MAENTAMRNNALPYAVYGVPWVAVVPILDADGDPVTSGADLDSEVSKNGDTIADAGTEAEIGGGLYSIALTGAQMTADIVAGVLKTSTAGAKTTAFVLYPRKLVTLATGTSQGGAAGYITLAAGAVQFNGQFNGCLCVATIDGNVEARILQACTASNQQCTVTPEWNVTPDADDTYVIYLPEGMQIPSVNVNTIKTNPVVNGGTVTFPTDKTLASTDNITAAAGVSLAASQHVIVDSGSVTVSDKTGFALSSTGADLILKSSTFVQAIVAAINEFATYGLTALNALFTGNRAEPGQGAPAASTSMLAKLDYLYKAWRNKKTQTSTEHKVYADDGSTVDQKSTVSADATTVTFGEMGTGA